MKNERFIYLFVLVFLFVFFSKPVIAESNYVLPYPSSMPGSLTYKIRLAYDAISRYWYFGDFGQFSYSLKMADKYLVEAKTLFEYKQYLLAYNALRKSDIYFVNVLPSLIKASKENKDIIQKRNILQDASRKHIEVLEKIEMQTPGIFIWQPEKKSSRILYLKKTLADSIRLRKKSL